MANTYCNYTQTTPTDNNKWTFSCWFKKGSPDTEISLFGAWSDGNNQSKLRMLTSGVIEFMEYQSSSTVGKLATSRVLRDPAAWMHLVCVYDTDNGTPADRMRMYINGVEETVFSTDTNPSSGLASINNVSGRVMYVGRDYDGGYWNGCMSWVQFVDGAALAPTEFGEFDSASGIWKLKTDVYGTPGANGFCLKMEDRTNLDLDSSSNAHTFSTSGAGITPTKDTPSNNFCTMNPIVGSRSGFTWNYGNTKVVTGTVDGSGSTLAFGSGKWYYELYTDVRGNAYPGWQDLTTTDADENDTYTPPGFIGINPGVTYNAGSGVVFSSYKGVAGAGDAWVATDYLGCAIDMDNLSAWWSLNGQWYTADNATATTLTRAQVSADTNGFDLTTDSLFSSASLVAPCMGCSTVSWYNLF